MAVTKRKKLIARDWFERLLAELETLATARAVEDIVGDSVRFVDEPLEIGEVELWPEDTGWFVEIATVRGTSGKLSVWLDRYLDLNGDAHLGVWYGTKRARAVLVADSLGIPDGRRYAWKHRDANGLLVPEVGRSEAARIGTWLVDDWRPSEVYVGKYVVASPHLQEPKAVIGRVLQALRQLADAAASTQSSLEDRDAPPPATPESEAERYRALMERLVRPGQARFRKRLLDAFGGRCVITGCTVGVVIDAAHINPVSDFGSDALDNGLLLRADLHRLFDDGLISISASRDSRVMVAKQLASGPYGELSGQSLSVQLTKGQRTNLASRNLRWGECGVG